MGAKYTTQAVSGFNAAPPADDGSATDANKLKWSTIKSKLGDPLDTWAGAIDTALVAAFDYSINQQIGNYTTVAADHMRTVEVAPTVTSAVTISLGDASTMTSNYLVRVKNSGLGLVTVGRITSGDTIDGVASNVSLYPGQAAWFATNSSADGYLTVAKHSLGLGVYRSDRNSVPVPNNVATTIKNVGAFAGKWNIVAWVTSAGASNYTSEITVLSDGSSSPRVGNTDNGGVLILALSGSSVTALQTSGGSVTVEYSAFFIG